MRLIALCAVALSAFCATAQATPVTYTFDLTVTELKAGARVDPHYAVFHLGQTFHGSLTYDPAAAIESRAGVYRNTTSLEVTIDGTLVTTRDGYSEWPPEERGGPYVTMSDGPEAGMDSFYLFEEVPYATGGYLGNYQAEQFWINLEDYDGLAVTSNTPAPIDFTQFDGGRWNFWSWGNEALYSSLLIYGSVGNIREVPTPSPVNLATLGLFALLLRAHRRHQAP